MTWLAHELVGGRENHAIISLLGSAKTWRAEGAFVPLASCASGAKIINKDTKDLRIVNDGSDGDGTHLYCLA